MNFFVKMLLFVLVALIANLKVVSAGILFIKNQKAKFSLSFHKEIPQTAFKFIENDLVNCCQDELDLVDYRN